MKKIMVLLMAGLFTLNANAFGKEILVCENVTINQLGDGYFRVHKDVEGMTFMPWETSYTVKSKNISKVYEDVSYALDQAVEIWAEGETWMAEVSFVAVMSEDNKKMDLQVNSGGGYQSFQLSCQLQIEI